MRRMLLALASLFVVPLAMYACAGDDPAAYKPAVMTARLADRYGVEVASPRARDVMGRAIERAVADALASADEGEVAETLALIRLARELNVVPDLDHAEEQVYAALVGGELDEAFRRQLQPLGTALGLDVDHLSCL